MSKKALAYMAKILEVLQASRSLTNLEIVAQLNEIQSREEDNSRTLSEHAWNKWKHGRVTPRPVYRRALAKWIGPPATPEALYQGRLRIDWKGEVTIANDPGNEGK